MKNFYSIFSIFFFHIESSFVVSIMIFCVFHQRKSTCNIKKWNVNIYIYKMGIDIIKQGWNSSNERIFLNAKFFINIIKIKRFHIKS